MPLYLTVYLNLMKVSKYTVESYFAQKGSSQNEKIYSNVYA